MKLDSLMKDLKDKALFGNLQEENIDKFISAEIPDKKEDPELYSLVSDHMMHGPCGDTHPKCSCMVDNSWSKNFPKKLQNEMSIDSNGFPVYRRRYLGNVVVKYLSACEAAWRIFSFDVHYRFPSVTRLPFHLPGQQTVVFADDDDVEDVLNKPTVGSSIFTGWMDFNQKYGLARTLMYVEFPTKFVWKQDERVWDLRKRGFSIGRIHHVPPAFNEAYYLRILLTKVRGPKDACYKRGLLDDDKEYIEAIEEAIHTASGHYLRSLFSTMLITYSISRPDYVWEKTWQFGTFRGATKNLALLEIQNFLLRNNCTLRCFPKMPFPHDDSIAASTNCFMYYELAYDTEVMTDEFERLYNSLTDEQSNVYYEIMEVVDENKGGVFFVYGYGGTGKTFLWKTLSASIRSKAKIILNVASSGIASLLLEGERAILAPLNEVVEDISDIFLTLFPGEEVKNLSSDGIDNSDSVGPGFDPALHSPDFLNGLKMSGMPNHNLVLKVGVPIMLLRNID
ncbi:uncharacterized protein LOC143616151 [Bidens hawaiensis]|uniref:uncharacterized protein LOC143616151 n=1 Tax=Bidens hawaiensis TaxID=980011 RepID=UPI00404AEA44